MMDASPGVTGINFRSSLRPYRRRRGSLILVCYALGRGRSITTKTDFKFYWFFSYCWIFIWFLCCELFFFGSKILSRFISRIVLFNILCICIYVGEFIWNMYKFYHRGFCFKYNHRFFKKIICLLILSMKL